MENFVETRKERRFVARFDENWLKICQNRHSQIVRAKIARKKEERAFFVGFFLITDIDGLDGV